MYPKGVDRLNISQAANLAATRAFIKICQLVSSGRTAYKFESSRIPVGVYLDGGLYLKGNSAVSDELINFKLKNLKTIVKGDEKYTAIKLASIVAKVTRDRYMLKLHKKYPQYGFSEHKGYGTKAHVAAIKRYGLSKFHRLTFTKNI